MDNKIELIGHYGGDLEHALSAWTSTSRELTDTKKERIPKLLKYLAENKHHTPFEKSSLHFLVTADIASHIHCLKHRIAVAINAESSRYKELTDDKYYIPTDWTPRAKNRLEKHVKTSFEIYHEELETVTNELVEKFNNFTVSGYMDSKINNIGKFDHGKDIQYGLFVDGVDLEMDHLIDIIYNYNPEEVIEEYQKEVKRMCRKRAKESVRFYLPYATQLKFDIMFNWRSFAHFQGLRNKPDAQFEIREIAEEMLELVRNIEGNPFEHTINAFNF